MLLYVYKEYIANYQYNEEKKIYIGKVANSPHELTFKGFSEEEINERFKKCIDNYIDFIITQD